MDDYFWLPSLSARLESYVASHLQERMQIYEDSSPGVEVIESSDDNNVKKRGNGYR